MKLYVAGPMSSIGPPTWNFPLFNRVAAELSDAGYAVINPADKGVIDGWTWSDYLREDIRALVDCQGVAVLDGYRESKGAMLEIHVATELGMEVRHWTLWIEKDAA